MIARPTSSVPSASSADGSTTRRGRCWSSSARPGCCAPRPCRTRCPAGAATAGSAGSPPSTRCCPAPPTPATTASPSRASIGGRTHEISRLIGRSLRACVDFKALGENTVLLDCDVLQADGGTRTAAITGAYVALADAVSWMRGARPAQGRPARSRSVAAVSVGVVDGEPPPRPLLRGGLRRRDRHERGAAPATAASSRCRAPPRAPRSTAPSWTRCSTSRRAAARS